MTPPKFAAATAAAGAVLALSIGGMTAAAAPKVAPGWPVMAPSGAGTVQPGPQGGFFVAGGSTPEGAVLTQYAKNGRRVLEDESDPDCGNCERTWSDYWSLSPAGVDEACEGDVDRDGRCVGLRRLFPGLSLRAQRAGREVWSLPLDGSLYHPESTRDYPESTVRDGAGISYSRFWVVDDDPDFATAPRMLSVSRAGKRRWLRSDVAGRALAGLRRGAVIFTPKEGLRAITPNGTVRWTAPLRGREAGGTNRATPRAISDKRRNRVYVFEASTSRVHAIDAASGRLLWKIRAKDLYAVGRKGTVYVSAPGTNAVRALAPSGKLIWQQRTLEPVSGAAELADGRVALATDADGSVYSEGGVAMVLNPSRVQTRRSTGRARLSRRVIYRDKGPKTPKTSFDRGRRTILSLDIPRASDVRVRIIDARGRAVRRSEFGIYKEGKLRAPAGLSFTSLQPIFGPSESGDPGLVGRAPRGNYRVEVRWMEQDGPRVARLPFVVR